MLPSSSSQLEEETVPKHSNDNNDADHNHDQDDDDNDDAGVVRGADLARQTTRDETISLEDQQLQPTTQQQQQSPPEPSIITAYSDLGEFDKSDKLPGNRREVNVGNPQSKVKEKDVTVTSILLELAAIQQKGPQSYCIIGTRHCSYLHQQIIEMLAYALVLSGNHVYTSGAGGTHAATIRGALRAEDPELLTVVLPQSLAKQPAESQQLLENVEGLIEMPQNDDKTLDVASRICNSYLVNQTDQMIAFAFHESSTVLEATREAREQNKPVTTLFLD